MKLIPNEKKVLKLLLLNSRMSDIEIAAKLNISNVAVGKIRKKLEATIIDSYSLNLNLPKMGIKTFAVTIANLTKDGSSSDLLQIEKKLLQIPHVIGASRIAKGPPSYLILYAFKSLDDIDNFFHFSLSKLDLDKYFENKKIFIFSSNALLKYTCLDLFNKLIDESKLKNSRIIFDEDN